MNVLFMGNLKLISMKLISRFVEDYRCVVYDERKASKLQGKNVINYMKEKADDEELSKLFATFDFESVIFFSGALDGAIRVFDELEKLESAIHESRKYRVKQFIYVTTNDLYTPERNQLFGKSRETLLETCEHLCKVYAEEQNMKFVILKVPYLYSMESKENQLMRWIDDGNHQKKVKLRGLPYIETDFLCEEDLGELLIRIIDEPIKIEYEEMFLSGENAISYERIAAIIQEKIKDVEVIYENQTTCIPCYKKDKTARAEYGWTPKHILADDIESIVEENAKERKTKVKRQERRRRYRRIEDKIRVVLEIIVLFVIAELLNHYTRGNVLVNFMDFRLIAVVMMGTMNGLSAGVISAILACVGYVLLGSVWNQWQILFYNVENWLPFACYFLLGAVSGYTRDMHDDKVINIKEEHELLEKKYVFLSELYNRALESKDNFNSQIIGYKDSFGKVYSVVKKLDTVLPEQVFYEAVNVLEELLENYSVAIYTINPYSDFARLNVCSKPMNNALNKSLKMSDYPNMMLYLRDLQGFVNTECIENYPAYAAPIYKGNELMGMILLMNASNHQMNMEFLNKFNIISDLVCNALVRAMGFEQFSNNCVEGTQILKAEKFKEILNVKTQMQEKQYLDYVLLRLEKGEGGIKELSDRVCRLVRNNDVLGMGEDGEVYLILSQTKRADLAIIEERMRKNDITFKIVKG
ncbi:MAG: NAD(P)-dependent oxidoreductase [Roseburia sp.]|nr:NAD(P)-dependent oxidoreductase [Roseburia sp.]